MVTFLSVLFFDLSNASVSGDGAEQSLITSPTVLGGQELSDIVVSNLWPHLVHTGVFTFSKINIKFAVNLYKYRKLFSFLNLFLIKNPSITVMFSVSSKNCHCAQHLLKKGTSHSLCVAWTSF